MENGSSDKPQITAGLEGFLEGLERRVVGEHDTLGIVHTEEAAGQMDGVPTPPEGVERPVWDDAAGVWRDATTYEPGIVLHAPESDREIRDSTSEQSSGQTLDGEAIDGLEPDN